MPMKKIAISLPQETLDEIDATAAEHGESRSAFIARMCVLLMRAKNETDLKRRANAVFADPEIQREQRETTDFLLRAGRREGTEWED